MKLILVRHGETEENKAEIIQGHLPGKLTPLGKEQAKKAALRLQNEQINAIYSSDLTRALDTAQEIAAYHQHLPLVVTNELRERHRGQLQGKNRTEIAADLETFRYLMNNPLDGENLEQLANRAKLFLDKLTSKHSSETVLLISHGGMIKALLWNLLHNIRDSKEIFEEMIYNTSVTIVKTNSNENKLDLFNCVKHLEE